MTDKILPCPFCGGNAEHMSTSSSWIRCEDCRAEIQCQETKEDAVRMWNRRSALAVQTQQGAGEDDVLTIVGADGREWVPKDALIAVRSALVDVPAVESEPVAYQEPIAWYLHLWNEADEYIKSDVRWGQPTADDIERAEHNGHDIEDLYASPVRSAIAPAPAEETWQPIETAPKDGTDMLVWADGYSWPEVVRYVLYKDPALEEEAGEPGYWRYSDDVFADVCQIEDGEFTYWQPISSPSLVHAEDGMAHGSTTDAKGCAE